MLPQINNIMEKSVSQPGYTYNINRNTNRISGYVDGKDAIMQAIYLILQTERYESLIYNWYYGVEKVLQLFFPQLKQLLVLH